MNSVNKDFKEKMDVLLLQALPYQFMVERFLVANDKKAGDYLIKMVRNDKTVGSVFKVIEEKSRGFFVKKLYDEVGEVDKKWILYNLAEKYDCEELIEIGLKKLASSHGIDLDKKLDPKDKNENEFYSEIFSKYKFRVAEDKDEDSLVSFFVDDENYEDNYNFERVWKRLKICIERLPPRKPSLWPVMINLCIGRLFSSAAKHGDWNALEKLGGLYGKMENNNIPKMATTLFQYTPNESCDEFVEKCTNIFHITEESLYKGMHKIWLGSASLENDRDAEMWSRLYKYGGTFKENKLSWKLTKNKNVAGLEKILDFSSKKTSQSTRSNWIEGSAWIKFLKENPHLENKILKFSVEVKPSKMSASL